MILVLAGYDIRRPATDAADRTKGPAEVLLYVDVNVNHIFINDQPYACDLIEGHRQGLYCPDLTETISSVACFIYRRLVS